MGTNVIIFIIFHNTYIVVILITICNICTNVVQNYKIVTYYCSRIL